MYKFVVVSGTCGNGYDISKAESSANDMLKKGYVFEQAYQTQTTGCNGTNSSLVMVFRKARNS